MFRNVNRCAVGAVFGASLAAAAQASVSVSTALDYAPGAGVGGYDSPAAATGPADAVTGESLGFDSVLSPFSPPFEANEITGISAGGAITLKFDAPINLTAGRDFGVFTNFGLIDADFPNGQNTSPAGTFAATRRADVEVSLDGTTFAPVGRITFEHPTNYFANAANPFQPTAPVNPVLADFGQPFTGSLSDFSGLNWPGTLNLLGGSAGGTWIDADAAGTVLGQSAIQYVRLSIPAGGIDGTDSKLFIDTVFAANASVPEPGIAALALAAGALLLRRRVG